MILMLIGLLFLFMLLGFPMLIGMTVSPLITMLVYAPNVDLTIMVQRMTAGVSTYVLLAVPMFIFAADIMSHGEMAERLLDFVGSWVKHVPGGLAVTTGGTCSIFGAISGSTQATLVAIGKPMFPPMLKAGYDISHVIGLLMCNANIALLIPPSVCMIMYCVCTGVSVGDLFKAGIAPGIFMFICFSVYDVVYALRHKIGFSKKSTWAERAVALRRAILALGFPALVLGGIYSGLFSPTEAAAASVLYALIVEGLVYRTLKLSDIPKIALGTARVTAQVFILIAGGNVFSWLVSYAGLPQMLAGGVFGSIKSPILILTLVSVFFFIACMFVDSIPVILIMSPIIFPIAMQAGVDPIHLGIIVTLQSAIGCVTPPFGANIFTACGIFHQKFITVVRGLLPYMIINIIISIVLVISKSFCLLSYTMLQ